MGWYWLWGTGEQFSTVVCSAGHHKMVYFSSSIVHYHFWMKPCGTLVIEELSLWTLWKDLCKLVFLPMAFMGWNKLSSIVIFQRKLILTNFCLRCRLSLHVRIVEKFSNPREPETLTSTKCTLGEKNFIARSVESCLPDLALFTFTCICQCLLHFVWHGGAFTASRSWSGRQLSCLPRNTV